MNDPAPEPSIAQLNGKIDDVVLGFRWMLAGFLLLISIPNICLSLTIEHFAQILREELPGKSLTLLTMTMMSCPAFLRVLTVVWPVLGILNLCYAKQIRNWAIGSAILAFLIGLQSVLTWMVCILPMGTLLVGTPDTGGK